MYKKENASVVFYTQDDKYAIFKYGDGKYALPTQKLTETDDNNCPPLGVARHILTQISGGFSFEMLNQDVELAEVASDLKTKFDPNDWNKLWMSIEYNVWIDKLSESYFSEVQINGQHYQLYYVKVDQKIFEQNMQRINIEYQLLDFSELKKQPELASITLDILNSVHDFKYEINQQEELLKSPNSTENTYVFILHKFSDFREKLKTGLPDMPTKAFYLGLFKKSHQKWLVYNAGAQILPTDEVLQNTKAIVQPGSSSSAYEDTEWTVKYREWIQGIYFKFPHLKFLSICFGEQILSHSLNGRCGMLEERKTEKFFYNVKIEELNFQESFFSLPYVQSLNIPNKSLRICKAHGDIVEEIDPTLFKVIASTQKYAIEAYIDVTHNGSKVLAIQGHPEYSGEWKCKKDAQFYSFLFKKDRETVYQNLRKQNNVDQPDDHIILRQICSSFLASDIQINKEVEEKQMNAFL